MKLSAWFSSAYLSSEPELEGLPMSFSLAFPAGFKLQLLNDLECFKE